MYTVYVIVDQPQPVSLNTRFTVPPCGVLTGEVFAEAAGGVQPYSYYINGNQSSSGDFGGLSQGNYTVSVVDKNACKLAKNVVVKIDANDVNAYATVTSPKCNGQNTGI